MKHQHRRKILRDVASLLAMPLALRPNTLLGVLNFADGRSEESEQTPANSAVSLRPKIAVPTRSVMRRA